MRVYIKPVLLILFISCTTITAMADIPIGTLITYSKPFVSNDEIIVINNEEVPISPASGLQLFSGDTLQTNTEEIFILIPSTSLIAKVSAYSELDFNVLDIGGARYVIQITANQGTLELLLHNDNDILQLVQGVAPPQQVSREDNRVDTSSISLLQYTQIINNGVDIITANVDYGSKVFITQPGFDIVSFINSLSTIGENAESEILLEEIIPPDLKPKLKMQHQFTLDVHAQNLLDAQYISGFYSLSLEKSKFFTTLQIPLFFPRNDSIYFPIGENDWLFGLGALNLPSTSPLDIALIVMSHTILDTLNKVKTLSYGIPDDFFYVYYGDQNEWHNNRSTLFAYHYHPIKSFPNNFNKDIAVRLNGKRLGYEFKMRQFQPVAFDTLIYESLNLVYNRLWYRPITPLNTFEIGMSAAFDFSVGMLNTNDTELLSLKTTLNDLNDDKDVTNVDFSSYIMSFVGMDVTIPFINFRNYLLESSNEIALYVPFTSTGKYIGSNAITRFNFVAKSGFIHTFFSKKNVITHQGAIANFYYTSGLAKPHYAMSGYEYTYMFYRTRSIAMAELNRLADTDTSNILKQVSFIPELEYFAKSDFVNIALGTNVPINISSEELFYPNPAMHTSIILKFDPILPTNIKLHLTGQYTVSNFRGIYDGFNADAILESLNPKYNYLNADINFEINNLIGTTVGAFTTPKYNDTGSVILSYGSSPELDIMPFVSLYIKINQKTKK